MSQIIDAGIVYGRPGTTESLIAFGEEAIMKKHIERDLKKSIVLKDNACFYKAGV